MMETSYSSLGRQSEEKHGIRKQLGMNLYYNLASVTIVWVWGEGLELEATKIRWKHVVGKKPKAKWGALLSSPCSEEELRSLSIEIPKADLFL